VAEELGLSDVCASIDDAFKREDYKRVEQLLYPALDQFSELPQLWFYAGNLNFNTGKVALAAQCFQHCIDMDSNPLVLANLGAALRRLNKNEQGIAVLEGALDRYPDYEPALVNLGSMFVNEGEPEKGIPALERAVKIGTEKGKLERGALWNLGLLYLEAGHFAEGFDIYRKGLGAERMTRSYGYKDVPEPEVLGPEHDGAGKTLIVYGEQGIGDELMAGTIIEDARKEFAEVIFECHPRLVDLHQRAHPGMRLFPTRKDEYIGWPIEHGIRADYKCPILDLAARYRRDTESFERAWSEYGPTYSADAAEIAEYRQQLEALAQGRPIVGLATHGGVIQTARQYRTMRVNDIDNLFANTDCLFVGLDYDDMTGFTVHVHEKFGENRYRWFPAAVQHWDYSHTAAMVGACDMVVTVCQSVAHLSAAMGVPTRVLTPKACAWRYAVVDHSEKWFWYPGEQVKLYRQGEYKNWDVPIARVVQDIKELT
jgi:tetratricopeptide (TPR) repeat protein